MKTDQLIRQDIWNKLHQIYYKYTNNSEIMSLPQLQLLLKEVFYQYSPLQIDYVTKNLFRIDLDDNGAIQFPQFANFILLRHCGQITLRRMHANNQIRLSKQRKITLDQFYKLINRSFKFLDVEIPNQNVTKLFYSKGVEVQKRKINNIQIQYSFITYSQALKLVNLFVFLPNKLNPKPPKPSIIDQIEKQQPTRPIRNQIAKEQPSKVNNDEHVYSKDLNSKPLLQVKSRFRKFLWSELRNLYEYYDKDRNQILDEMEVQNLVYSILKNFSKQQSAQIIFNSYKIHPNNEYNITFYQFVPFFIQETVVLGLSRLNRDFMEIKKKIISRQKFISLIRNTFNYIPISRVSDILLFKIFDKLAKKENPNYITYQIYLRWVVQFLCPVSYFGVQYYLEEDDQNLPVGNNLIASNQTNIKPSDPKNALTILRKQSEQILVMVSTSIQQRFIKLCLMNLQYLVVNKYDVNKNNVFEKNEVQALLLDQLKYNQQNVQNFIKRIMDYFKINAMSHSEFIRFLLYIHLKQYSLQQFVKFNKSKLKRPNQQMLNMSQFLRYMDFATIYIIYKQPNQQIQQIFKNIDRNNDGWISYKQYEDYINNIFTKLNLNQKNDQDSYYRRIWINLRYAFSLYDTSRAGSLTQKELQKFLRERFLIASTSEIATITGILIKDLKQRRVTFYQFAPFIINYQAESILKRYHLLQQSTNDKINNNYFIVIVNSTFEYAKNGTKKQQIDQIFKRLDTDKDGYLKYSQFLRWVDKDIAKVQR